MSDHDVRQILSSISPRGTVRAQLIGDQWVDPVFIVVYEPTGRKDRRRWDVEIRILEEDGSISFETGSLPSARFKVRWMEPAPLPMARMERTPTPDREHNESMESVAVPMMVIPRDPSLPISELTAGPGSACVGRRQAKEGGGPCRGLAVGGFSRCPAHLFGVRGDAQCAVVAAAGRRCPQLVARGLDVCSAHHAQARVTEESCLFPLCTLPQVVGHTLCPGHLHEGWHSEGQPEPNLPLVEEAEPVDQGEGQLARLVREWTPNPAAPRRRPCGPPGSRPFAGGVLGGPQAGLVSCSALGSPRFCANHGGVSPQESSLRRGKAQGLSGSDGCTSGNGTRGGCYTHTGGSALAVEYYRNTDGLDPGGTSLPASVRPAWSSTFVRIPRVGPSIEGCPESLGGGGWRFGRC